MDDFNTILQKALAAQQTAADNRFNAYKADQDAVNQKQIDALATTKAADETKVNATTDDTLQKAWVSSQIAEKALPQLLSARGITGGGVESTLQDQKASYQNARNDAEKTRATGLTGVASDYNTNSNALSVALAKVLADYRSSVNSDAVTQATNEANTTLSQQQWQAQQDAAAAAAIEAQRQWQAQQDAAAAAAIEAQRQWQATFDFNASQASPAAAAAAGGSEAAAPELAASPYASSGTNTNANQSGKSSTGSTSNSKEQALLAKAKAVQASGGTVYKPKSTTVAVPRGLSSIY